MSKIMVVEDDASLREIYSIRITAEGYDVVSAGDGEEALAMAVREKPDLILSDVMMPKISGFDMLDILRSTPETAGIKVVMMTALSADDQRARGERLGANRYLVKSQVGIEDVVNTIHEVLGDKVISAPATETAPVPAPAPASTPASVPTPAPAPASAPTPTSISASTPIAEPLVSKPVMPVSSMPVSEPVAPVPDPASIPMAPEPMINTEPIKTEPKNVSPETPAQ